MPRQPASPHMPDQLTISRDLVAAANGEAGLRENPLDMNEAIAVSEMLDHQQNNDRRHILALKDCGLSHQSAYEAGLASGREAGYQRGYREGFSDGCKLTHLVTGGPQPRMREQWCRKNRRLNL